MSNVLILLGWSLPTSILKGFFPPLSFVSIIFGGARFPWRVKQPESVIIIFNLNETDYVQTISFEANRISNYRWLPIGVPEQAHNIPRTSAECFSSCFSPPTDCAVNVIVVVYDTLYISGSLLFGLPTKPRFPVCDVFIFWYYVLRYILRLEG